MKIVNIVDVTFNHNDRKHQPDEETAIKDYQLDDNYYRYQLINKHLRYTYICIECLNRYQVQYEDLKYCRCHL